MVRKYVLIFTLRLILPPVHTVAQEEKAEKDRFSIRLGEGGKRVIFMNDKPFVLLGAFNVESKEELEPVKAAGINTLGVEIPWSKQDDFDSVRELAQTAAEKGLWVVLEVSLIPPRQRDTPPFTISPRNQTYLRMAEKRVQEVVEAFRDTPNLIGYASQRAPALCIEYGDADFQSYLQEWYSTPQNMAQFWRFGVSGFEAATLSVALTLDDSFPVGFARSSVDVCVYKCMALTDLMRAWARMFQRQDKDRLIFTGRLNDYKSIICVPSDYDVCVPCVLPTQAEPDKWAHNLHAVDMARQGNTLIAVPVILSGGGRNVQNAEVRARLPIWINETFLHGAGGIWLSDWKALRAGSVAGTAERRSGARETGGDAGHIESTLAKTFQNIVASRVFQGLPRPTAAFIYEPFGEGAVLDGQPLYGFAEQLSLGEPSYPFIDFRRGTQFGQMDYLSHDTLVNADLSQYRLIIAPLCLWLSLEAEEKLARFVQAGGVLLADMGIGMAQAGGTFVHISPTMQRVFGIWGINRLTDQNRNMTIFAAHPLLPSLQVGMMSTGTFGSGFAFARPIGLTRLYGDTIPVGLVVRGSRGSWRDSAGTLSVHPFGEGFGVYAPFRIWPYWHPENRLYQEFHGDLLRRGAIISLNNALSVFPSALSVAAMGEGVAVSNAGNEVQYAQVDATGISNLIYSEALTAVSPLQHSETLPTRGQWLSVIKNTVDHIAPQVVTLHLDMQPNEMRYCRLLPVQLNPAERYAFARVTRYDKDQIEMNVMGPAEGVSVDRAGKLSIANPASMMAQLIIGSGEYEIPPRSRHQIVAINTKDKQGDTQVLMADERGRLVIERRFQSHKLTVTRKVE